MANTVTSLSYANTFGEWVVATNSLIRENNDLAANDYIKSTGTIYLNETTQNALQSNGTVIIQKELLVQGTGSSATVQNNLNVGSQLYLTNGTLSLVASGQANVAGQINGQASGIGLFIANNAHIGGTTVSAVRLTTGVLQANSSVNTSNASIVNTLYTKDLQANSTVNTATASVTGTTFTNVLQANTSTNTSNASIVGTTYTGMLQANTSATVGTLQANTSTNTATASVTGTTFTNVLQANTSTNTATASVTGTTFTNILQANTSTNTGIASVTGTTFTGSLQANTSATVGTLQANTSTNTATASVTGTTFTNVLQANTSTNTGTASVTGTTFTNVLQANTSTNTATASVTGTTFTNVLQANTTVNTATVSVTGTVITNEVAANTSVNSPLVVANNITSNNTITANNISLSNVLNGNTSTAYFNSIFVQGGGLTINGNFVLTGTTVYTANTFLLSANVSTAVSSFYNVDRGSTGVDAAFRWNEPAKYWDTLNVTSNTYYRVLTDEYFNDTLTSTSTTSVATANAVNALNTLYNTSNTFLQAGVVSAGLYANGAFLRANAAYDSQNTTGTYANSAYAQANTATNNAAGASLYANGAFIQANAAYSSQNTTGGYANSAFLRANSAYASQNVTGTYANSAYAQANAATTNAAAASSYANSSYTQANTATTNAATADGKAVTAGSYANSAYGQANTATTNAATADGKAVTAGSYANSAYTQANTATNNVAGASLYANGAFIQANAAFLRANTPDAIANSAALYANGAFVQANAAFTTANSALNASNLSSGTVPLARLSGITTTELSASAGITNSQLANNTISGIPLGSTLGTLSAGNYLSYSSGTTYTGNTSRIINVDATTTATASKVAARDSAGDLYANTFRGLATSANYADLAEKYLTDQEYEIGTVVSVGGEKEVTASSYGERAIGVVSAQPAYMMNSELEGGTYIALKGRVPVKVTGTVRKGQRLVAYNNGTAVAAVPHANDVFGVALESSDDTGVKLIEAVIL
jgi:hypothetical protein